LGIISLQQADNRKWVFLHCLPWLPTFWGL
jgi:hypothetical protein